MRLHPVRMSRLPLYPNALIVLLFAVLGLLAAGCGGGGGSVSVTPAIPAAPTITTATSGNGQVTLAWNLSPGATSYNIYRDDSPNLNHLVQGALPQTVFTNTGLTNGTAYIYEVTAQNISGESAKSAPMSVTLPVTFTLSITPAQSSLNNDQTQTFTAPVAGDGTNPANVSFSIQNGLGNVITTGGTLGTTSVVNGIPTVVYTAPSPITAQTYFVVATYASTPVQPGNIQKATVTVGAGSGSVNIPIQ